MGKTREEIAAAYSSPPWWYDLRGFVILTFAYNSTLTHQVRFFAANIGPAHLEVACGTGTLLELVLRWRALKRAADGQVTAIDYADAMLAGARRRFAGWRNVSVQHADAAALPYPDATFDTINIANAVHCLPEADKALRDVFRVLRPGGTLALNALLYPRGFWPFRQIATAIDAWGMRKGILYRPFVQTDIQRLIRDAGFEITAEDVSGNCYDAVARRPAY